MAFALPLTDGLKRRGVDVAGPAATLQRAARLAARRRPDAAVLDLELLDGVSAPIAAKLTAERVPFWLLSDLPRPAVPPPSFRAGRWIERMRSMEALIMDIEQTLRQNALRREVREISVRCPACEVLNRIVASPDLDRAKIECSACGAELGRIEDLAAPASSAFTSKD